MRPSKPLLTIVLSWCALHAQPTSLDSLELQKLSLHVAAADELVVATDLFHRLLPRVTFSASFGTRNAVFADPDGGAPRFIPADAWRVTIALPLSEFFGASAHEQAKIERARRLVDLAAETVRRKSEARLREDRSGALRQELLLLAEEYEMLTRIVRYQRILFEEGKTDFDALARTELQTLEARRRIVRTESQLRELTVE